MYMTLYTIKDRNKFKVPVEKITINGGVITIIMRDVLEYRETLDIINENRKALINLYIYDEYSNCGLFTKHIYYVIGNQTSSVIQLYLNTQDVLNV